MFIEGVEEDLEGRRREKKGGKEGGRREKKGGEKEKEEGRRVG